MTDKSISALSSATTPLAGTEVLPIVQSNATVKVPVADLTKGRTVSATGVTTEGATNLGLGTNGTTTGVTVTPAGNIGVGVTPSTWLASSFAVQYGPRGSLFNRDSSTRLAQNAYFDAGGAPKYIASGTAEVFLQTNRNFYWQTAPSGSADGAITLTERMRLDDAGNLTINTGNLVVGTAGKGIDFSANTAAAGMTSELLTWYEEGSWTPVATSATGTITTYTSNGRYTRIGNTVYVIGLVATSDIGTASGKLNVAGLPFTSATNYISSGLGIEVVNTGTSYFSLVAANATTLTLQTFTNGGISWANNSQYHFTLTYRV